MQPLFISMQHTRAEHNSCSCSNALIGGGFQFQNPNAESSCGCGKSFGV